MLARSRELWWALLAIILITLLYGTVVIRLGSLPAARSFVGHAFGIFGFLLMLMTETLYSLRKRSRTSRWGRMAKWLQFHIFTGLVGPYLVFLHSAWEFNGLAGVVLMLTVVIVISGFIGRYIYTAVPRTADGIELQGRELGERIRLVEAELSARLAEQPRTARAVSGRLAAAGSAAGKRAAGLVFDRALTDFIDRWNWWREQRRLDPEIRMQAVELNNLVQQRRILRRQIDSLAAARRLLSIWHAVHIPIGFALFTAALVHIGAAIYYATLLH